MFLIAPALLIILIISWWKIYTKAQQPGWAVFIPIYNILVWLKIINKPWWWIFLYLIPLVNIIIMIIMYHGLSKVFCKDAGFTVGLILLPFIFIPILGLGNAQYVRPQS
jgi:hypothetical protein